MSKLLEDEKVATLVAKREAAAAKAAMKAALEHIKELSTEAKESEDLEPAERKAVTAALRDLTARIKAA